MLDEAIANAAATGAPLCARVERELVRLEADPSAGTAIAREVGARWRAGARGGRRRCAGSAAPGCCEAWVDWTGGQVAGADAAWVRAAEHAQRTGDSREQHLMPRPSRDRHVFGPTAGRPGHPALRDIPRDGRDSPAAVRGWSTRSPTCTRCAAVRYGAGAPETRPMTSTAPARPLHFSVSHHGYFVLAPGRPPGRSRSASSRAGGRAARRRSATARCWPPRTRSWPRWSTSWASRTRRRACAMPPRPERALDESLTQIVWRGVAGARAWPVGANRRPASTVPARPSRWRKTDLLSVHADAMLDFAEVLAARETAWTQPRRPRSWACRCWTEDYVAGAARDVRAASQSKKEVGGRHARKPPNVQEGQEDAGQDPLQRRDGRDA